MRHLIFSLILPYLRMEIQNTKLRFFYCRKNMMGHVMYTVYITYSSSDIFSHIFFPTLEIEHKGLTYTSSLPSEHNRRYFIHFLHNTLPKVFLYDFLTLKIQNKAQPAFLYYLKKKNIIILNKNKSFVTFSFFFSVTSSVWKNNTYLQLTILFFLQQRKQQQQKTLVLLQNTYYI